jgi:hypothetical protein
MSLPNVITVRSFQLNNVSIGKKKSGVYTLLYNKKPFMLQSKKLNMYKKQIHNIQYDDEINHQVLDIIIELDEMYIILQQIDNLVKQYMINHIDVYQALEKYTSLMRQTPDDTNILVYNNSHPSVYSNVNEISYDQLNMDSKIVILINLSDIIITKTQIYVLNELLQIKSYDAEYHHINKCILDSESDNEIVEDDIL